MFDMDQIQQLMSRAQEAQSQMKDRMEQLAIEGTSGGGVVRVIINGNKELTKIDINPSAFEEPELLPDLILAAMSQAYAKADEEVKGSLSGMLGNIDLSQIANMFRQ